MTGCNLFGWRHPIVSSHCANLIDECWLKIQASTNGWSPVLDNICFGRLEFITMSWDTHIIPYHMSVFCILYIFIYLIIFICPGNPATMSNSVLAQHLGKTYTCDMWLHVTCMHAYILCTGRAHLWQLSTLQGCVQLTWTTLHWEHYGLLEDSIQDVLRCSKMF